MIVFVFIGLHLGFYLNVFNIGGQGAKLGNSRPKRRFATVKTSSTSPIFSRSERGRSLGRLSKAGYVVELVLCVK